MRGGDARGAAIAVFGGVGWDYFYFGRVRGARLGGALNRLKLGWAKGLGDFAAAFGAAGGGVAEVVAAVDAVAVFRAAATTGVAELVA